MDTIKEALAKIQDENLRKELEEGIKPLVIENGKRGQALIERDEQIKQLTKAVRENSNHSYTELFNEFKKVGMDVKDIPKFLEKLKVEKTAEDEKQILAQRLKELEKERDEANKKLNVFSNKETLNKLIPEVLPEFKDASGKPVDIKKEFIKVDSLAEVLSTDPTVAKEQVKKALTEALTEQERIARVFGYQPKPVVGVPATSSQTGASDPASMIKDAMKAGGPAAAFAAKRALEQG